jgi:hypothetical protein
MHRKVPMFSPLFWPANGGELAVSIGPLIPPEAYKPFDRETALQFFHNAVAQEIQQAEKMLKRW